MDNLYQKHLKNWTLNFFLLYDYTFSKQHAVGNEKGGYKPTTMRT